MIGSSLRVYICVQPLVNEETKVSEGADNHLAVTVAYTGQSHKPFYFFMKRCLDVTLSTVLLMLLSPVLLTIAILIKLDSPGPIIFSQKRIGARRRMHEGQVGWEVEPFHFYKFRSMVHNADPALHRAYVQAFIRNDQGAMAELQGGETEVRKLVRDPRITRVGAFIRRTSLDELPQLWNVLKGDMSLVGPRPALQYEVDEYEPWHRQRLETLPGITGLWQVTARSSAAFDDMIKLDIAYLERQSLWLDLIILIKTPLAVVSSKGAL